jgi:CHAT domain-containing protein
LKYQKEGVFATRLGDFENALNQFENLYRLRVMVYGKDSYRLAPVLNAIGISQKQLGRFYEAIESLKKSEQLYIGKYGKDYPELGGVYTNLGNIYQLLGDLNKSVEYQKYAVFILQKDSIKREEQYKSSKYNLVETQLKMGENDIAIKYALSNLKSTLPILKPRLYDIIALAYRNKKEYNLSEKYYLESIKSWEKLLGKNNVELVSEYLAYSSLLLAKKDFEKAFRYSGMADSIVLNFYSRKSTAYADVQSSLGDYYFTKISKAQQIDEFRLQRKSNLFQAIQFYQNAIVALTDSFNVADPLVNPPLRNIISEISLVDELKKKSLAMVTLADVYLSEFDSPNTLKYYTASLNALSEAIELIHRLQIGFENEESRLFLAKNQQSTFDQAVNIAYKLYAKTGKFEYIERAFEFSERSKSSSLLASVKDMRAKQFGGIPDSLLKKEAYLKNNISSYTSSLYEENHSNNRDSQKVNLFTSRLFKANEEYSKLISSFERDYPSYYAFKYQNKVIGIKDVQANLNSKQALVEYYTREPSAQNSNGELYRFVITRDSVKLTFDPIDSSYLSEIEQFHSFLVNPDFLYTQKKDFVSFSVSGFQLYEKLIRPIRSSISGKEITIVPHDKLSYIPFDALLSAFPDTSVMNFRNLDYLVRDYTISYSYSATLLYEYFDHGKSADNHLLIFSPEYVADRPRVDEESSRSYLFNPLPGAKSEVEGISKYIKSTVFSDAKAQKRIFGETAANFDVLHLAMHTIINDSLPMFSKLVFSSPDSLEKDDGMLNTYEIYNMKLKARLAVLSACETGSGKLQKGEGVMSMARGFIYAGCPSILMTLWQIEDKSGARIMSDFYRFLSRGKRKDVALRMAKLNHLDSADPLTAHPHYWLGYVLVGNQEPLYAKKDVYFVVVIFAVIIFLAVDWYMRKKPRDRRG